MHSPAGSLAECVCVCVCVCVCMYMHVHVHACVCVCVRGNSHIILYTTMCYYDMPQTLAMVKQYK